MIRLFEMFAGYGGASWALKKAGFDFECVGYSEIYEGAITCYDRNFPGIKNYKDCRDIDPGQLPDFDLLTGGFPCQPFSEAGDHRGELDTRGTLFYDIIRIAEKKKPRYIFLENVVGLTFQNHRRTYDKILSELNRVGYKVYPKVMNSQNYGTPQRRERVYFVCYRKDIDNGFEFPKEEKPGVLLKDLVDPPSKEALVSVAIRNKLRSKAQALGVPYGTFPIEYHLKHYVDAGISYAVKSATHEFMVGTMKDVESANLELKKSGITSPKDCFRFLMSKNIRPLTPKEAFRLMGFFDDEIDLSGLTQSQKYRLAGDGWDVGLVAKILAKMLKRAESEKPKIAVQQRLTPY